MKLSRSTLLVMSMVLLFVGALIAQNTTPSSQTDQQTQTQPQSNDQQPNNADQMPASQQPNGADDQTTQSNQEPQTLIDPGLIYNAKQPGTWIGKTVTLKNVTVQDTNDGGNFWVGSDGGHRLLVVKSASNLELHALRVHKGDIVVVTGEIQPASVSMVEKTGASKNSMNDAEKSSGVFLLASSMNIASSTRD